MPPETDRAIFTMDARRRGCHPQVEERRISEDDQHRCAEGIMGPLPELEARIRSHTANGIYEAGGQVPETIMTGGTADISHIGKYGWFDWVLFRDLAIKDRTLDRTFARYLIGPAVN